MTGIELGAIAAIASIMGGVTSAQGAIAAGNAEAGAAEFNASVADQNRRLAQQQANAEVARRRRLGRASIGTARAAVGASGILLGESAADVLDDLAITEELNALNARHEGRVQSASFENTARLERLRVRSARTGARRQAGTELLSGVSGAFTGFVR